MDKREEMLSLRSKLLAEHPDIVSAYDLAPLMGEFEREYWEWQLDTMLIEQAAVPITVNLPPSPEGNPDHG